MISLTNKAITEIKRLISKESALRINIVGGGCSGMSYKLGVDSISPKDKVFEQDGVRVICDPKSYLYLSGIEIDFSDGLNGTGFIFNNPNAKRTCGCGSSFS